MNHVRDILPHASPQLDEGVSECWMDLDGARLRYLRAGSGPALILLHGLLAYSFSWRYTMPALAPYRTVYALDMLGAGFSDRPKVDHSMRATALRVLTFLEKLGISSFDLLGTSRGGAVAMCVAADCLGSEMRLGKLVLVAPVNPYSSHGKRLAPFMATPIGAAAFRWMSAHFPQLFPYFHSRLYADRAKIPEGSLEGYKAPLSIPGLFEHGLRIVRTWTSDLHQLEVLLPTLRDIPTLLIWGGKDPAVYVSSMEPLARHFANVTKIIFPDVGHLPYEECPDEFNRALIEFLNRDF